MPHALSSLCAQPGQVKMMESAKKVTVDQLFLNSRKNAMKFALRLTGNREEAEDLIQDAFLKVSKALESRDIPENPQAWMYTAIRNSYIDRIRRAKRRVRCTSLEEAVVDNSAAEPVDTRLTPEEVLMSQNLDPVLVQAIASLTRVEKQVLLESIDGLSGEYPTDSLSSKSSAQRSKMLSRVKRKVLEAVRSMSHSPKWDMAA